jgi:3-hydroxybutyryl-CoA dehydrogenase reduced Rossmann-fold domain/3-hydroxyacyl-CoA dehydrogenase, C-terminal domain
VLELPGGALIVRCAGATATSLSAAFDRPVIVVDRMLDPATATAIAIAPSDGCPPAARAEAIGLFQAARLDVFVLDDVPGLIVTRTVAMLANLAADALASRVASEADIDTAMRLGVNYPLGPLAWAREWGTGTILSVLDSLENWYRDGHYRASPLLRRTALSQRAPASGVTLPRQSPLGEGLSCWPLAPGPQDWPRVPRIVRDLAPFSGTNPARRFYERSSTMPEVDSVTEGAGVALRPQSASARG